MKNKCFLLMKVQLLGQFRGKEKKRGTVVMMAAYLFVDVMIAAYSFLVAAGLGAMELSYMIPWFALAITSVITLFFTVLKANGVLFAYRDYELLLSFPIKTGTVIASRFLSMYLMNLLFTAVVMLPMGAGYVIWEHPGIGFYPIWLLGMMAAPLLPTTAATVIGALIILFTSRFRHANVLTTILTIGITSVIMVLSFGLSGMDEGDILVQELNQLGQVMLGAIHRLYPPSVLFERAVISFDMFSFFTFLLLSIGWYLIFLKLVSLKYKSMNTALMSWHARSDYKLGTLKTSSPLMAVCRKEAKRFFGCPMYTTNMGIGLVMMVLFGVALAVMGPEKLEKWVNIPGMSEGITKVLPFMIAMLQCMSCTTCVSLSLEGRNLWILKSLPLDKKTVYQGKILFNLLLTVPAGILVSLLIAVRISMSAWEVLFLFIIPVVYAVFISVLGMYINIKFPKYDWTSEAAVVKQSASSMAGIFAGMFNALIPLILMLVLQGMFAKIFEVFLVVLEGGLAYFLYRHVIKLDF